MTRREARCCAAATCGGGDRGAGGGAWQVGFRRVATGVARPAGSRCEAGCADFARACPAVRSVFTVAARSMPIQMPDAGGGGFVDAVVAIGTHLCHQAPVFAARGGWLRPRSGVRWAICWRRAGPARTYESALP